ncbi:MAG: hypothetical protein MJ147_08280 [Clostridia bacterium]|nr:hypothetical protein [Clostridia bacterium]
MPVYVIAGIAVEYEGKYDTLIERSKKYLADESTAPLITIKTNPNVIENLRKRYPESNEAEYEYTDIGASFNRAIIDYDGIMLHSSAVAVDGKAYLFSAPSGMGKSTHTGLWQKLLGEDKAVIINDDKPVIRKIDGEYYAFGTPFSGKHDISINKGFPLKGICFVRRGEENSIERLSTKDAVTPFLNQTVKPANMDGYIKMLSLTDDLLSSVPCYSLICRADIEAAEIAYNAMKGEENENKSKILP